MGLQPDMFWHNRRGGDLLQRLTPGPAEGHGRAGLGLAGLLRRGKHAAARHLHGLPLSEAAHLRGRGAAGGPIALGSSPASMKPKRTPGGATEADSACFLTKPIPPGSTTLWHTRLFTPTLLLCAARLSFRTNSSQRTHRCLKHGLCHGALRKHPPGREGPRRGGPPGAGRATPPGPGAPRATAASGRRTSPGPASGRGCRRTPACAAAPAAGPGWGGAATNGAWRGWPPGHISGGFLFSSRKRIGLRWAQCCST